MNHRLDHAQEQQSIEFLQTASRSWRHAAFEQSLSDHQERIRQLILEKDGYDIVACLQVKF